MLATDRSLNPTERPSVLETGHSPEEAFDEFTRERYGRLVSAVQVIVHDRATAEDIAQETFARAFISWGKLWPDGNPTGWVHRVAANLAISWHRRAARELRAVTRLGKRTEMTVPGPESHHELHREIAYLPPRQRAVVAVFYVAGLSVEETAKAMGCKEGTVKSLLHAARGRLRERLGEDAR